VGSSAAGSTRSSADTFLSPITEGVLLIATVRFAPEGVWSRPARAMPRFLALGTGVTESTPRQETSGRQGGDATPGDGPERTRRPPGKGMAAGGSVRDTG
jgi:hypothetical protein